MSDVLNSKRQIQQFSNNNLASCCAVLIQGFPMVHRSIGVGAVEDGRFAFSRLNNAIRKLEVNSMFSSGMILTVSPGPQLEN